MIWLLLLLIVMAGIFVNSARLFLLGLLIMAQIFSSSVLQFLGTTSYRAMIDNQLLYVDKKQYWGLLSPGSGE